MSGIDDGEAGQVVGSEDCLTLNIWAPAFDEEQVPVRGEQLPVMVWLHGGGNTIGTANTYPGPHLAGGQQVVYVTINYRMGRLGWDETPSNWMADFPGLLGAGHDLEVSFVLGDFEGGISVPYLMSDDNEAGREALDSMGA